MELIQLDRRIAAPVERCFLLWLNIDLHVESASPTGERAVAGVTDGVIGAGESVTWRGRHFGLMLMHTSIISAYERPAFFEDSMTQGMFAGFVHRHFFTVDRDGTVMRDELRFAAPLGVLGLIAERVVLRRYLRDFFGGAERGHPAGGGVGRCLEEVRCRRMTPKIMERFPSDSDISIGAPAQVQ